MSAQQDDGFVEVQQQQAASMPAPSPQMPAPARAVGGATANTDALASFLAGSGITESATVAGVLRGEQVHDPGSFLALDADDVVELLATAKRQGVSVGDRAKLKALIRASGNTAVSETPRPSPRQAAEGIASLRAQFDATTTEQPPHSHPQQQQPPQSPAAQMYEEPRYDEVKPEPPPPIPAHAPPPQQQSPQQSPQPQPQPYQEQWKQPPATPYPAQHSPPPAASPAPAPPPRDHGTTWRSHAPQEPGPAPGPAPAPARPASPFRNPFAPGSQAQGFFDMLILMTNPMRSGACDFIDAMVVKYVRPVIDGRGLEAFGYNTPLATNPKHLWMNSAMPRVILFYAIFRGFIAMTTRVDGFMAFCIGFFLRKRPTLEGAPPPAAAQRRGGSDI